jgi:hypothetical protein
MEQFLSLPTKWTSWSDRQSGCMGPTLQLPPSGIFHSQVENLEILEKNFGNFFCKTIWCRF